MTGSTLDTLETCGEEVEVAEEVENGVDIKSSVDKIWLNGRVCPCKTQREQIRIFHNLYLTTIKPG
jgi:hypothetical protein